MTNPFLKFVGSAGKSSKRLNKPSPTTPENPFNKFLNAPDLTEEERERRRKFGTEKILTSDRRSAGRRILDQIEMGLRTPFAEDPKPKTEIDKLIAGAIQPGPFESALDITVKSIQAVYGAVANGIVETGIEAGLISRKERIRARTKVTMALDVAEMGLGIGSFGRKLATKTATKTKSRLAVESTKDPGPATARTANQLDQSPNALARAFGKDLRTDSLDLRLLDGLDKRDLRDIGDAIGITTDGASRPTLLRKIKANLKETLAVDNNLVIAGKPSLPAVSPKSKLLASTSRQIFAPQATLERQINDIVGVNLFGDAVKATVTPRVMAPEDIGLVGADRVKRNVRLDTRFPNSPEFPDNPVVREVVRQVVNDTASSLPTRNKTRSLKEMANAGEEIRRTATLAGIGKQRALRQHAKLRDAGGVVDADNMAALNQDFIALALRNEDVARKIVAGTATEIERAQYLANQKLLASVSGVLEDNVAEVGRALRLLREDALRIQRLTIGDDDIKLLLQGRRTLGDPIGSMATAHVKAADNARDIVGRARAARQMAQQGPFRRALSIMNELIVSNMVMGPATQIINTVGNTLFLAGREFEFALGANPSRTAARMKGAALGTVDGMRAFGRTLLHERMVDIANKTDLPLDPALKFSTAGRNVPTRAALGAINLFGRANRSLSVGLLGAMDSFFKSITYRAALHSEAYTAAIKSGLNPRTKDFGEFIKNFVDDAADAPSLLKQKGSLTETENMLVAAHKKAVLDARRATFTEPMGPLGRGLVAISNTVPGAKFVLPFVSTPVNIQKQAFTRTPMALMHPTIRAQIKAGGVERNAAIARVMVGSGFMGAVGWSVSEGLITGAGPIDPDERRSWLAAGNVPYSINLGGTRISIDRLDPFATILGIVADGVNVAKYADDAESEDIAIAVASAVGHNLINKTYLSGMKDFIEVLTSPDRRLDERFVVNNALNVVPILGSNLVAQISRAQQDTVFSVRTALDVIRSRASIIVGTDNLTVRRDVFGDPIPRINLQVGGVGIPVPARLGEERDDATKREIRRLGIGIRMPRRKIAGVELEDAEYWEQVRRARQPAKQYLDRIIASPSWSGYTNIEKINIIKRVLRVHQTVATRLWMSENLDRMEQARERLRLELEKK